jgi:hypothetical protein
MTAGPLRIIRRLQEAALAAEKAGDHEAVSAYNDLLTAAIDLRRKVQQALPATTYGDDVADAFAEISNFL